MMALARDRCQPRTSEILHRYSQAQVTHCRLCDHNSPPFVTTSRSRKVERVPLPFTQPLCRARHQASLEGLMQEQLPRTTKLPRTTMRSQCPPCARTNLPLVVVVTCVPRAAVRGALTTGVRAEWPNRRRWCSAKPARTTPKPNVTTSKRMQMSSKNGNVTQTVDFPGISHPWTHCHGKQVGGGSLTTRRDAADCDRRTHLLCSMARGRSYQIYALKP
jgi:hypothetical protein